MNTVKREIMDWTSLTKDAKRFYPSNLPPEHQIMLAVSKVCDTMKDELWGETRTYNSTAIGNNLADVVLRLLVLADTLHAPVDVEQFSFDLFCAKLKEQTFTETALRVTFMLSARCVPEFGRSNKDLGYNISWCIAIIIKWAGVLGVRDFFSCLERKLEV